MKESPFDYSPGFKRDELRVLPSRLGGMGVFCEKPIKSGDLIELSTITILTGKQVAEYESTHRDFSKRIKIRHYLFELGRNYAIPNGFGCFYNHAPSETGPLDRNHVTSNASFSAHPDLELIAFTAKKDIPPNNEILIDFFRGYNLDYERAIDEFRRTYNGISREDGLMTPMPGYRWSEEQKERAYPRDFANKFRDLELEDIVARIASIKTPGLLEKIQKVFTSLGKNRNTIAI